MASLGGAEEVVAEVRRRWAVFGNVWGCFGLRNEGLDGEWREAGCGPTKMIVYKLY